MAKTSLKLMTRHPAKDGKCPVYVVIRHRGSAAYVPTTVRLLPSQWDEDAAQVINTPAKKTLNSSLSIFKDDVERQIFELAQKFRLANMTAMEIKEHIVGQRASASARRFLPYFEKFAASRKKQNTRDIYHGTAVKLRAFDRHIGECNFEDITPSWLDSFERWMETSGLKVNTISIHLRNIRAVLSDANRNDLTSYYPFRKVKIRTAPTEKRSLSVAELRKLRDIDLSGVPTLAYYRDIFMLMFYMRGINAVDLCNLTRKNVRNGNIYYIRSKTGRPYTVKLEPEMSALMDAHQGSAHLVDCLERCGTVKSFVRCMNRALKRIGPWRKSGPYHKVESRPLWPELSTYWARHTWATVAAGQEIAKETIAAGLGHGGRTVTDIYIDFDQKKVDAANRLIIDFVNGTAMEKRDLPDALLRFIEKMAGA